MTPAHRLVGGGWNPSRGALFLICACGWEDVTFPADPAWFDRRLVGEEAEQVARFRRHLEEVGRG